MDTGKHQSPHKQHHSAAVSSSSNTSELDDFVISASFLRDAHVTSLWLKCLNLGFNLELITETFKEYLAQHFVVKLGNHTTLAALTSLTTADYKLIFNEDKFIERIIQLAENLNKASHADRSSDNDSPPLASDFANELNPKADEFVFGAASGNDFQPTSSESNRRMQLLLSHQQQQRAQAAHFQAVKLQQEQASHIKHKAMQDLLDQSISRLNDKSNLRPVIIDGNDVGTPTNTAKQVFSFCRVRKVAEFFEKRNHTIYVMFPQWRKESLVQAYVSMQQQKQQQQQNGGGQQSQQQPQLLNQQQLQAEQEALKDMEDKEIVNFTPSKRVGSKHIKTDDDMFILQLAVAKKAIIVSNDNFKRFLNHSEDFKHVVEERVLMYSFIDDTFMPAEDPLGKNGPSLDNFLRFESLTNQQYMKRCPYRRRCTYGNKCKYWHPERDGGMETAAGGASGGAAGSTGHAGYKSAHQGLVDQVAEEKLKVQKFLNSQMAASKMISDSADHYDSYGSSSQQHAYGKTAHHTAFTRMIQPSSDHFELRAMGPESIKPPAYSHPMSQQLKQQQLMMNMNKNMSGMSLQQQQHQQPTSEWPSKNSLFTGFNPVIGSSGNYSPFNSAAATILAQQTTQYGSSEIDATVKLTGGNKIQQTPPPGMPAKQSSADLAAEDKSSSRNLSPKSIRSRLAEILDEEKVAAFLVKYAHVTDESKLIFLAQSMDFDDSAFGF